MIRVDFHLKERQLVALKELSKKIEVPVAELIRRAVDAFLGTQSKD
jgi:hypothetical protein